MNLRCLVLGHQWQKISISAVCARCRRIANHVATDVFWMAQKSTCPRCGLSDLGHMAIWGQHFETDNGVIICPETVLKRKPKAGLNPFLEITNT